MVVIALEISSQNMMVNSVCECVCVCPFRDDDENLPAVTRTNEAGRSSQ